MQNIKNCDYDIIVLAGQSNAEGNGLGDENLCYLKDERVYQVSDKNNAYYKDEKTNPVLQIVLPMEKVVSIAEERDTENGKATSFAYYFVQEYIKKGYLKRNRKILLLKGAIGGTGFSRNEWGIKGILYNRLKDLTNYGLNLGGNNRIVALLWHQGEHDSFEQKELSPRERYNYYYQKLSEQMNDFRKEYGKDIPIIAGEMCPSCKNENLENHLAVERATKDYFKKIENCEIARADDLLSNDDRIHNGDNAHFCRKSCVTLGERYFKIFEIIIQNL